MQGIVNPYMPVRPRQGSLPEATPSPTGHRLSWAERKAVETMEAKAEVVVVQDVKPKLEVDDRPRLSEAALEELRAKEEEARIMAELPPLRIPFGRAQWEADLDNHYKRMMTLQQTTNRAQSAQRIAAAILADAEAERMAALERRKIVEAQLMAGTLGVGVGMIGGV